MSAARDRTVADLRRVIGDRQRQLAERTAERDEGLAREAAMSEVLGVVNSSPGDLAPVFQAILQKAHRLCEASFGALMTYDGERFHAAAHQGTPAPFREFLASGIRPGPGDPFRRMVEGAPLHHVHDLSDVAAQYPGAALPRAAVDLGGIRTLLVVPLRKDNELLGVITAYRREVRPFTDKQIALLQSFAAQAVIAMENARLLTETREALEQQTATAEVLQIINAAPGDLAPVFDAMLERAMRLCEASFGYLLTYDGSGFLPVADRGHPAFSAWVRGQGRIVPEPGTINARIIDGEAVVQVADVAEDPSYRRDTEMGRAVLEIGRFRTVLTVALRKDGALRGVIHIYRQEVRPFAGRQVALLQNFAEQAVIAMENARLLNETRQALAELRATQQQLVVQQKMAALGQLTAGIAHEIKNPLNFVNNFAGLSVELLGELKAAAGPAIETLDDDTREEIGETFELLTGNLDKIAEHGRRADGIVQSMLAHSRGTSAVRQKVDINALVEEALNLAYHGARARDGDFNITLEREFDDRAAPIELVPQDVQRVFLNLIGNGFYAVTKRAREAGDGFRPALKVTTRDEGDAVVVRVRDNGIGIGPEIRDKLFQPFFTTKPTGEGTGLGLSLSYDIVTTQHGGTITVDSAEGAYTEFTLRFPRSPGSSRSVNAA